MEKLEQENNKYYTPDVSEFYVGFEYEIQNEENAQWGRFTMMHLDWSDEDRWDLEEGRIRVKFLDREDIESLEFKHIGAGWYENERGDWKIRKWKKIELDIWFHYSTTESEVRFRGNIKNKSELVKILKMLDIE